MAQGFGFSGEVRSRPLADGRNAWLRALRCGELLIVQGKGTPCRGHAIGEADGMIGTLTRRVIVLEQQRLGMQHEDGRAGMRILQALQQESPTP